MKNDCTLSFSLLFHSKDSQVNSIRFESQQYLLELFFLNYRMEYGLWQKSRKAGAIVGGRSE